MKQKIETLKQMIELQSSNGKYNYDENSFGVANGMIFALSIFTGGEPKYLEKPKKWLKKKGEVREEGYGK